jgi:hypothetical protein
MLIEIDRLRLEELRNAVQDAVVVVKKHIKRTNDVVFYECENSDPIVSMANVQQEVERKLEFSFKAFEYSNIGSGCTLHFTLGKNATVRSSTPMLEIDGDGEEENNEPNDGEDTEGNTQGPGGAGPDYLAQGAPEGDSVQEAAEMPDALEIIDVGADEELDDGVDLDESEEFALESERSYSTPDSWPDLLCGVRVLKCNGFGATKGPRGSAGRQQPTLNGGKEGAKDMCTFALELMSELIQSNEVVIRDGRSHMEEYDLARDTVTVPRKRGWAVRPPWGKQYGAHYIKMFTKRIAEGTL